MSQCVIYKRASVPIHILDQGVLGFQKYPKKYFGDYFNNFIYFTDRKIASFIYSRKTIKKLSNLILDKIARFSDKKFFHQWKKTVGELQKISYKILKLDLDKITDKQRLIIYQKIARSLEKFYALTAISIDLMDLSIEDRISEIFDKVSPKNLKNKVNRGILIQPVGLSFVLKKEKELIALSKHNDINKLQRFQDKYFWINFGWQEQHLYTLNDIKKDLKVISKNRNDKLSEINKKLKNIEKTKNSKHKLLKKINNKQLNNLVDFSDKMIFYHDDRKKNQMISLYAINKILKSIKAYQFDDLLWMTTAEIENLIITHKALDMEILKPINFALRKHGSMVSLSNQKLTYSYGLQTRKKFDQLLSREENKKNKNNQNEVVGIPSSPGIVRGKVRIIFDPRVGWAKISKNDVLIAPMTDPNFLPIMKKCAAIVTDEGGLTCHAAIISRELGIPCIIGTKIATKVFKDGEMVEVNANKGIVKKLDKRSID